MKLFSFFNFQTKAYAQLLHIVKAQLSKTRLLICLKVEFERSWLSFDEIQRTCLDMFRLADYLIKK